jgi:hypothetical protein
MGFRKIFFFLICDHNALKIFHATFKNESVYGNIFKMKNIIFSSGF